MLRIFSCADWPLSMSFMEKCLLPTFWLDFFFKNILSFLSYSQECWPLRVTTYSPSGRVRIRAQVYTLRVKDLGGWFGLMGIGEHRVLVHSSLLCGAKMRAQVPPVLSFAGSHIRKSRKQQRVKGKRKCFGSECCHKWKKNKKQKMLSLMQNPLTELWNILANYTFLKQPGKLLQRILSTQSGPK